MPTWKPQKPGKAFVKSNGQNAAYGMPKDFIARCQMGRYDYLLTSEANGN